MHGQSVAQLEILVRTAVFKSANALVGWLLQKAADRADVGYQPKAGQARKGRETIGVQGIFGRFQLERDYYYHPGKDQGHCPADAALGLEVGYTPALAKLIGLEGADEPTYLKAERHLEQTGGIVISARQIQRVVQRVGSSAQQWQERQRQPGACAAPVLYVSADGTGVPMVAPELKGRRGKQADGTAKTRQVYLGCVFTQHRIDERGQGTLAAPVAGGRILSLGAGHDALRRMFSRRDQAIDLAVSRGVLSVSNCHGISSCHDCLVW